MINKKLNHFKWVKYALVILTITLSSLFIFNYAVDPYGRQNIVCEIHYKPILNERAMKYKHIFSDNAIEDYDSLILGSSRVMSLKPSHFSQTSSFYNFGVHVANNQEKLFIIKEWLSRKKLKTVYLGIDYYNFHNLHRPLFVDVNSYKNANFNYFSIATFKLSLKSLLNKFNDTPITYFNPDGSINYYNDDIQIKNETFDFSQKKFEIGATGLEDNMIKSPFVIEEQVFDVLKEIKEIAIKNDIKLYVFITPMQHEVFKKLEQYPELTHKFNSIDKKLVTIFDKVFKFSNDDAYNAKRKNFYDPWHYRDTLGDEILKKLHNKSDYGTILLKEDSEEL